MNMIRVFLSFFFASCVLSSFCQQYKLYSSDDRVYYQLNGIWKPVYHDETLLDANSKIKSEAPFSVVGQWDHRKIIDCPPSKNGQTLGALIKQGNARISVVPTTSTKKGEDLSVLDVVKKELSGNFQVNFHYLLLGVHKFQDDHWNSLPVPKVNVEKLSEAIEDKMIPYNKYHLKGHSVTVDSANTTQKGILNLIKNLADSVKPYQNDMVFLYLSSHGVKDKDGKFHFITTDTRYDSINHNIEKSISADTLNHYVNRLASKGAKVLVFVDACYSGTLIMDIRRMDGSCVYFMSTENDLVANDDISLGSPFARALIRCVSGEEQVYFRDDSYNTVTPQNLQDYLFTCVQKEYSKQRPVSSRYKFNQEQTLWRIRSSYSAKIDSLAKQARFGKTDALVELGDIYYDENVARKYEVEQDTSKAMNYYRYAYEWGNPMGACRLGMNCYYQKPNPDYDRAFNYFEESAYKGCDLAKYYLFVCYYKGLGVTVDKKRAKKVLKTIEKINTYDIRDAFMKEQVFIPVTINGERINMFIKDGLFHMIIAGSSDPEYDSKHRPELYVSFLELYASNGDPKYQAVLGDVYLFGLYNQKANYEKALYWYNLAIQKKYKYGYYGLALLYTYGLGVEKDYKKAEDYYKLAADKNVGRAFAFWGDLYYVGGHGIPKDERQAVALWKKSAEKKDILGMYKYGNCLKEGKYVPQNNNAAFSYFLKCAKKGHAESQYLVGVSLYYGEGTNKDTKAALKWLTKAKDNNNQDAKEFIDNNYYVDGTAKN